MKLIEGDPKKSDALAPKVLALPGGDAHLSDLRRTFAAYSAALGMTKGKVGVRSDPKVKGALDTTKNALRDLLSLAAFLGGSKKESLREQDAARDGGERGHAGSRRQAEEERGRGRRGRGDIEAKGETPGTGGKPAAAK